MKKIILSLMSFVSSFASAQGLTAVSPQMNCGEMLYRQASTYTVEFKNEGNEPIEIKSVDTGCGCTTASFTKGLIQPYETALVSLTFDCNQLGHFMREVRVIYTSGSMMRQRSDSVAYSPVLVKGIVVAKKANFSGNYPYRLGLLLTDKDNIEFDDVHQGQKLSQDIHILNPSGQNVQPQLLRLPAYLTAEMTPVTLAPGQSGVMHVSLNSARLQDYGLNQITAFLGKNSAEKFSPDKIVTISAVLLPPAVSQDDVNRPYAPKLSLSKDFIDMRPLSDNPKYKDEIIITNNGHKPLEIQKLQFFTTGLEVSLEDRNIEPGASSRLVVTCKSKDIRKLRVRPRILMITNDPDRQKVVITVNQ